jgi:hypothetical protein
MNTQRIFVSVIDGKLLHHDESMRVLLDPPLHDREISLDEDPNDYLDCTQNDDAAAPIATVPRRLWED